MKTSKLLEWIDRLHCSTFTTIDIPDPRSSTSQLSSLVRMGLVRRLEVGKYVATEMGLSACAEEIKRGITKDKIEHRRVSKAGLAWEKKLRMHTKLTADALNRAIVSRTSPSAKSSSEDSVPEEGSVPEGDPAETSRLDTEGAEGVIDTDEDRAAEDGTAPEDTKTAAENKTAAEDGTQKISVSTEAAERAKPGAILSNKVNTIHISHALTILTSLPAAVAGVLDFIQTMHEEQQRNLIDMALKHDVDLRRIEDMKRLLQIEKRNGAMAVGLVEKLKEKMMRLQVQKNMVVELERGQVMAGSSTLGAASARHKM